MVLNLGAADLELVPRLAHVVCHGSWAGYLDRADIVQAGYVGLLLAASRYEAARGPFARYASARVVGAMRDTLHVATRGHRAESLDAEIGDEESNTWHELVADCGARPVAEAAMVAIECERLRVAMAMLPARSLAVVDGYYRQGLTQLEIGAALGVSESRVEQIRASAVRGLRLLMW